MGGILERLQNWWKNTPANQRMVTLGGMALSLLLLYGVFSVASRPKYTVLYGGITPTEQAAIVADLQAAGYEVKYDTPGAIEVPSEKAPEIRNRLVMSGKAPKGAHLGIDDLSGMNAMTPPKVEQERLNAIREGQIATTIESNPGVRAATVHITLGDPSPFSENQRPPTASVSLITAGAGAITRESAKGIAMLVANSVDGLELKHVVVLDERGSALFNGNEIDRSDTMATNKLDMENAMARKEENRLQAILDQIYGAGSTRVSVKCELDLDTKHIKKTEKKSTKGTPTKTMIEKMDGAQASPGGISGASGNAVGAPAAAQGKGSDRYTSTVIETDPTQTVTEIDSQPAAGSITSMVINVAADTKEGRFDSDEKMQGLKDYLKNEMANKEATDKKFQCNVTGIKFDDTNRTIVTQAQTEANKSAQMQQLFSLLPIVALLIVGVMVVKQVSKLSKPTVASVTTSDGQVIQIPIVNGQVPTTFTMPTTAAVHDPYPMSHKENLNRTLSQLSDEELAAMSEDGVIYLDSGEVMEVEKIREKKSVHLAAIKQMAKDRPEPTAMLIKTWLAETPSR